MANDEKQIVAIKCWLTNYRLFPVDHQLELQSAFARCLGQHFHTPMILVPTPVKYDLSNTGLCSPLGQSLTYYSSLLRLVFARQALSE